MVDPNLRHRRRTPVGIARKLMRVDSSGNDEAVVAIDVP